MRKYIKQVNTQNFVYPNNTVAQYDDEIIHDINNNSVSGTVTNFVVSGATSTGLTVSFDWTWSKNNAEPFISEAGNINLLSAHMMTPQQQYFGAWRTIDYVSSSTTGNTSYSGHSVSILSISDFPGISSFVNGVYNFEIRFIGHRAIYPLCSQYTVSTIPVPTPTPTPSPQPAVTPTPTPSAVPNPYTSGATINVTDTGWIKYTTSSGDTYQEITSLGNVVLTNCLICNTIREGIPFADLATFTVVNCGTSCSAAPPAVTPSPTPSTQPPLYYRITDCQTYVNYYTQQFPSGTFNSGDRVEGSYGYYYVVSGTYSSPPSGVDQRYVSGTGLFGCA
jgi:hypothetical protein